MTLRIPAYAKRAAREGLMERQYNGAGLSPEKAAQLGIASGVSRARQIIRQRELGSESAQRVAAFYQRFKGQRTARAETAIKLWGGRRFGRSAVAYVQRRREEQ